MNTELLVLAVLVGGASLLLLADVLRSERAIRKSVFHTSRFRLFAARDALIHLVVDEKITDEETQWRDVYGGVNDLLDESQRMGFIGLLNVHLRFFLRMATHEDFRDKFQGYMSDLRATCERVPEFGKTIAEADKAVFEMCLRRTNRFLLLAYLRTLKGIGFVLVAIASGMKGASSFLRVVGASNASQVAFRHHESGTSSYERSSAYTSS